MKRIQYHQYGGPEVLRLEEVVTPAPGKGELLVRVMAASANPADYKVRDGYLKVLTGSRFPRGYGHDFAGVVERVGEGVTRFQTGDAVFGGTMARPAGTFAEWAIVEEKYTAKKPAEVSFEEASSIATGGGAGFGCAIKVGKVQAGERVLVTGCLGAVGRTAAQLAIMRGATVAGSCRDTARADAEAIGIDPVFGFDFDPAPLEGRFDLVIDAAGVLSRDVARRLIKRGGRVVDPELYPTKILRSLFSRWYRLQLARWAYEELEVLGRAVAENKVDFPVARTVPLDRAIEALTELEKRRVPKGGKLVVTPWARADAS